MRLGEKLCSNAEEFKAWSQNLGHEGVLTIFYSYGDVADYRQAELLRKLAQPKDEVSPAMEVQIQNALRKMLAVPL